MTLAGALVLTIPLKRGVCRWCSCTVRDPCAGGCGWADREETLCTSCVNFNREIQTVTGRKKIARRLIE
jgi:hypothetical protein